MSKNRNQNTRNQLAPSRRRRKWSFNARHCTVPSASKALANASCKQQVAHEDKPPITDVDPVLEKAESPFPREQQTPEALGALVKAGAEKWWPVIKASGIRAE